MSTTRREFIKKGSLGLAASAIGMHAASYERVVGANDQIGMAWVGLGRRVPAYYPSVAKQFNTKLHAICDVKKSQVNRVLGDLEKSDYKVPQPKVIEDYRELLENPDIDAVFLATPDHWHAPGTVMALEAGKHVYVEKPCSHNLHESAVMVKKQRETGKVVQMGNQQRSSGHTIEIMNEIHNGVIGKAYKAVAFYSNGRGEVPKMTPAAPPDDLNWALFQGPAPRQDYHHNIWNYNWHWYGWKWGTAETGNNATHEVDVARWALQVGNPRRVEVEAAKQHFPDDGWEMYDTMYATFDYDDGKTIHWDGKSRNGYNTYGSGRGTVIYGTDGSVFVNRSLYKLYDRSGKLVKESSGESSESGVQLGGGGDMSTNHIHNFFEAIRGKAGQHSPIHEGAISTNLCHYANVAYRTGKGFDVDTETGKIYDREAMKLWKREYEPGWEI